MRLRNRQPAQVFVMAALATTAMIGALSMVVDAGVYFVIQRQLQNAADAAALAAVWYGPVCQTTVDPTYIYGCQQFASHTPAPPNCTVVAEYAPCTTATDQVIANWGVALSLCQGPTNLPSGIPIVINAHVGEILVIPHVNTYVVSLSCEAPHWFGRIFPNVAPTMHIATSAAATVGWRGSNGQVQSTPGTPAKLIARLIV